MLLSFRVAFIRRKRRARCFFFIYVIYIREKDEKTIRKEKINCNERSFALEYRFLFSVFFTAARRDIIDFAFPSPAVPSRAATTTTTTSVKKKKNKNTIRVKTVCSRHRAQYSSDGARSARLLLFCFLTVNIVFKYGGIRSNGFTSERILNAAGTAGRYSFYT